MVYLKAIQKITSKDIAVSVAIDEETYLKKLRGALAPLAPPLDPPMGSTHWRRKYKTYSIRSTKSDRLTTRIRCGHNKQSEV